MNKPTYEYERIKMFGLEFIGWKMRYNGKVIFALGSNEEQAREKAMIIYESYEEEK